MDNTKVAGTITEKHTKEVREVFGKEVADRLEGCEGSTFLDILFQTGK